MKIGPQPYSNFPNSSNWVITSFLSQASKEKNCTSWSSSAVDIMNVTVDIRTCKKILDMVVEIGANRRVDYVEE